MISEPIYVIFVQHIIVSIRILIFIGLFNITVLNFYIRIHIDNFNNIFLNRYFYLSKCISVVFFFINPVNIFCLIKLQFKRSSRYIRESGYRLLE